MLTLKRNPYCLLEEIHGNVNMWQLVSHMEMGTLLLLELCKAAQE